MTARQYAESFGVELVGKLTRKVAESKEYDYVKDVFKTVKTVYWTDEVGNELMSCGKGKWVLITADGGVC